MPGPMRLLAFQGVALGAALSLVAGTARARPSPGTPSEERRVLILGDSMAATDFGRALQTLLNRRPGVDARREGKSATGLARPDFFDWMLEGARLVETHQPDLVVVVIGGNDGQDLVDAEGTKARVQWNGPGWKAAYADRVQTLADTLAGSSKRRILWVALPVMARKRLEDKLVLIRSVQRTALAERPWVEYLETGRWFVDEQGALLRSVTIRGESRPLRQEDGVHFSLAGARWFAGRVAPLVMARLQE